MNLLPKTWLSHRSPRVWFLLAGLLCLVILVVAAALLRNPPHDTRVDNTRASDGASQQAAETVPTQNTAETGEVTQIAPTNDPQAEKALLPKLVTQKYCSALEKACFTYPPTWTFKQVTSGINKEEVRITSPDGTTILWQYDAPSQLSGSCNPGEQTAWVGFYASLPNPNPHHLYLMGVEYGNGDTHHLATVHLPKYDIYPPLGDTGVCAKLYAPHFTSRQNDNILATLRTTGDEPLSEHDTPVVKEIIQSFTYQ